MYTKERGIAWLVQTHKKSPDVITNAHLALHHLRPLHAHLTHGSKWIQRSAPLEVHQQSVQSDERARPTHARAAIWMVRRGTGSGARIRIRGPGYVTRSRFMGPESGQWYSPAVHDDRLVAGIVGQLAAEYLD